jgi:predicted nucleic acid-binding protein
LKENFVLDACALIAFFNRESGTDSISDLIYKADDRKIILKINQVNLLEVYYKMVKIYGKNIANEMMNKIERSPIKVIAGLSKNVFNEAGLLKITYGISVGDSIAAAECVTCNGTLVTSDHKDFGQVEQAGKIRVLWFK